MNSELTFEEEVAVRAQIRGFRLKSKFLLAVRLHRFNTQRAGQGARRGV